MAGNGQQKRVAIACQGGGSHAAFCAGVLKELLDGGAPVQRDFTIHGLSGTSGGAICAALAWYGLLRNSTSKPEGGLLLGSPADYLDAFWDANSAHGLLEGLFNSWAVLMAESPIDIKTSPYDMGSRFLEWQRDFTFAQRPEFIHFEQLLSNYLDFAHIGAVMQPFVILKEIRDQLTEGTVQSLAGIGNSLPPHDGPVPPELRRRVVQAAKDIHALPDFAGVKDLAVALVAHLDEATSLTALADLLDGYARAIPLLVVGSVDVLSGEFKAFSCKDGPITVDMVRASAAIPEIFRAVEIDRRFYWDGLFSQNPPVTNFISSADSVTGKPDEIWVVQVNPQARDEEPTNASAISDRRNELSGNLSLNQEISAIQTISRLVEDPNVQLSSGRIKRIDVFRIPMNSDAFEVEHHRELDLASKLDRSATFIHQLIDHGCHQGRVFRHIRHFIQEVWNQPDIEAARAALARITPPGDVEPLCEPITRLHGAFSDFYVTVDRTEFTAEAPHSARALLGWRGRGSNGGKTYELTGKATLTLDFKAGSAQPLRKFALSDIRIQDL